MVGMDDSWFFVFTAPVAELTVVSFTVPLCGWTIAATVLSCSRALRRQVALLRGCMRRDVVWWLVSLS